MPLSRIVRFALRATTPRTNAKYAPPSRYRCSPVISARRTSVRFAMMRFIPSSSVSSGLSRRTRHGGPCLKWMKCDFGVRRSCLLILIRLLYPPGLCTTVICLLALILTSNSALLWSNIVYLPHHTGAYGFLRHVQNSYIYLFINVLFSWHGFCCGEPAMDPLDHRWRFIGKTIHE